MKHDFSLSNRCRNCGLHWDTGEIPNSPCPVKLEKFEINHIPISSLRYLWEHPGNPHSFESYRFRFGWLVTLERLMSMKNWKPFSPEEKKINEILVSLKESGELQYPLLVRDNLPLPLFYVQVGMQRLACMKAISVYDPINFLSVPAIVIDKKDSWDDRIKKKYYKE
ncbi:MAG TPA: hypothetical protein ENI23_06945 [bacterium]|nr:hypothetical protein [bacterium]